MERKVIIVAPTYNEEANIGSFIASVLVQNVEVLISDSHSLDGTAQIVKELALKDKRIHYLDIKERGLGLGLSRGLDYAINKLGADILITMEADLSCDPKQIPGFIDKLDKADFVVGSRYVKGGKITNWSWWRRAFSLGANLILRILAWTKLHEFTNLYRAFTKEVWLDLKPKIRMHAGWLFVPAFIFESLDSKFKIIEYPIIYFDRFGGRSKMKTLSYTKNLLHFALKYRLCKIF
ncbi:glycosyltransferase [Candidatus Gottesmanbacteria bacterium]|nr:glycosyltransferase [Candidatus Gottesmanbacteria bacterium]